MRSHALTHDAQVPESGNLLLAMVLAAPVATMPLWRDYLHGVSSVAADIAPVLAITLLVLQMWVVAGSRPGKGKVVSAFTTALLRGAKSGLAWIVILLGIAAVAHWLIKPREPTRPHALIAQAGTAKRRPADDAGEDGDADDATLEGGPEWLRLARAEIGTLEGAGSRNNPKVLAYYADAGHPEIRHDSVAWCAAFLGAMLERVGTPCSKSLMARSYERWGVPLETPQLGCVVVLWRTSPRAAEGHVGFYVGGDATHVHVLGGNQADGVNVKRFARSRVLAYRWPRKASSTRTVVAAGGSVGSGATSQVLREAEQVQGQLADMGQYFRWAAIAAGALSIALAIYVIYRRMSDMRERGV